MNGCQEKYLRVWMVFSVLIGVVGGYLTYHASHNTSLAGSYGLRYFMLAYIVGWVLFKIAHFVERTRPEPDDDKED